MSIEAKLKRETKKGQSCCISALSMTATFAYFNAVNSKAPLKIQVGVLAVTPQH